MHGVDGQVLINGNERSFAEIRNFLRFSCYIQQDTSLRDCLTVHENMMIASELKVGQLACPKQKKAQVDELLEMLGLASSVNTMAGSLSGGQKKRLSIAFELLTNPPVIFLDEPTTGLDSMSCKQTVSILKMLANQGRTVVATIHQPSALVFEMFDNLYALADGHCIYNGTVKDFVPYMADKGLPCPVYHNPADFLIEVAVGEYGPVIDTLLIPSEKSTDSKPSKFKLTSFLIEDMKSGLRNKNWFSISSQPEEQRLYPQVNSFFSEFFYLYMRNLIILQRNYMYRLRTMLAFFLCGCLMGLVFLDVGNNAERARSNFAFVFGVLNFVCFVSLMSVCMSLPNDIKSFEVEHFNQWYSITPYYLSILTIEVPMQIINIILAWPVMYILADQPMEPFRISFFLLICILTSLCAQAWGFFFGSSVPVRIAVFVGPIGMVLLSVFGFTLRFSDTPLAFQLLGLFSFVRSAFASSAYTLYAYDRSPLNCEELYCHFKSPEKILKEMDLVSVNIYANMVYIMALAVFLHLLTFGSLYRRVNNR